MKTVHTITVITGLFFCSTAFSQKLPTEQQTSLRAPAGVKVDGKPTEWHNAFQAFNRHTDLYYTIANDDDKLYLVVQATDPAIVRRAINGAITLTINKDGQKTAKGAATITYPVFEKTERFTAPLKVNKFGATTISWTDSVMMTANKNFSAKAKLIQVTGIKNVDTLISVYNTDGIKAVALFDNSAAYTYELSVPLKSLGLSINNAAKFAYQIKINDVVGHGVTVTLSDGSTATNMSTVNIMDIKSMTVSAGAQSEQAATDFWAEYTLIK